jgi:hypothetical protein
VGVSFVLQHIREVALDHQAGIFAGTNDVIETIGASPCRWIKQRHDRALFLAWACGEKRRAAGGRSETVA